MDVTTDEPSDLCRWLADHRGGPNVVVWTVTAVVVGLAVVGGGPYDPELAVLTVTAVAIVWYAYWTFRVARPDAWVKLRINPVRTPTTRALFPQIENQVHRRLYGRVVVRLWVDEKPIRQDAIYGGARWFTIEAGLSPAGHIPLEDHMVKDGHLLVMFTAEWIDAALCESGRTTKYWSFWMPSLEGAAVIDPQVQREWFTPLPDPYGADSGEGDGDDPATDVDAGDDGDDPATALAPGDGDDVLSK